MRTNADSVQPCIQSADSKDEIAMVLISIM